jgi:hypothetical protein
MDMLLQNQDLNSGAGERCPSIIPAGPPPAIRLAPRPLDIWAARGQGRKPLSFPVVPWILLPLFNVQPGIAFVRRR